MESTSGRHSVLLLGFGTRSAPLTERLRRLRFSVVAGESLEEAIHLVGDADHPPVRAALIPPDAPLPDLPHSVRFVRERSREESLRFVVVGPRPGEPERQQLRAAGLDLALWEPFNDGELRFVVNHVLYNPRRGDSRSQLRVPTSIIARVIGSTGEKVALVYNLSLEGAYLETDRPNQAGAKIQVELPLTPVTAMLEAEVLSNNVVGNLYRENLPTGMGVRFLHMEEGIREALGAYIEERAMAFQL